MSGESAEMASSVVSFEEARKMRLVAKHAHEHQRAEGEGSPMTDSGSVSREDELPKFDGKMWMALGCLSASRATGQVNEKMAKRIFGGPWENVGRSVVEGPEEGRPLDPEK